ncbi:MAG: hypothetical protein K0R50_2434 [Eubacterium sp.]|nr:hypothetical protein [Eubacterium sp.]
MDKHSIQNVPRYYEPYVSDCFNNALAAQLSYMGLKPNIILADYLSFLYDSETGYMGVNYLYKYNTSVEFTEEELNTSFQMAYFPVPELFSRVDSAKETKLLKDRILVKMYLENDSNLARQRLKELIDGDMPAVVAVDLHYMQYHRAYKKDHGLHYIVVTGYDEEGGWYELFDKYRLSSSDFDGRLPIDEIILARESENPQKNPLMGEFKRPLQNVWCEIGMHPEFKIEDKQLVAILKESCNRMSSRKNVLGIECGVNALNNLLHDLEYKKNEGLEEKNLYLFKTYYNETFKTIARSRKRFNAFLGELDGLVPSEVRSEAIHQLEESANKWDICANLSLKLGITRSIALINDIINQLGEIREREMQVVKIVDNWIENG